MTHPALPRRIPRTPPRPWGRPLGGAATLLLLLGATACGGEPGEDAAADDPDARPDAGVAQAPSGTDVWLGEIHADGDSLVVTALHNATARPGYDNQPAFLPDGSGFLYTVIDSAGQADIWRYDLQSESADRVTRTNPESEYSATPLPGGGGFSAVRVEADSTQRLWRFGFDGEDATLLLPDVAPVGYHAWADEERGALFVLGDPPTLRIAGGDGPGAREVARDIGRSIQTIPGEAAVSFVQHLGGDGAEGAAGAATPDSTADAAEGAGGRPARIMRWSVAGGISPIRDTPPGGDDHAWTPDGTLLMGDGSAILAWREGWDRWRTVGRVPGGGTVSRLAVSPDGARLAVVVEAPATD